MEPREIEELLPFYALDALTDEEKELVESYLAEHPEARVQIEEISSAADSLPYGVSPVEPSSRTKAALMARVAVEQRSRASKANQPSRPRVMRFETIFQAFSLGAATVAIIWAVVLNIRLSRLQNEVSLLGEALVAQSNSLEQINAKLPQVIDSNVVTVSFSGTTARPNAHGQLIADPNSHSAVLVIAGLSQLEAGKTYQVWLIDGGGPKSAGLLTVDENGQGLLILSSDLTIAEFKALGISIEPEGGSEQPTGDIVVLGDL
jgi:anti-sigma-K factor RskA